MKLMLPKPVSPKEIETYAVSALKRWLKKTMSFSDVRRRLILLDAKTYQVDISVVSGERMAKINHAFRKVKKATDILSFPTHEFFQQQGVLGDLVICGPVAVNQAQSIGHSWKKEMDVLIVHGILHLLNFDHETSPKDSKSMADWELKILGREYGSTLISRNHDDEVEQVNKGAGAKALASEPLQNIKAKRGGEKLKPAARKSGVKTKAMKSSTGSAGSGKSSAGSARGARNKASNVKSNLRNAASLTGKAPSPRKLSSSAKRAD